MTDFIPQIEPWIDESELFQLKRVIDKTYVVEHDLTKEFESLVREHTGSRHALSMANGTLALYSCLRSMGIGEGDEVIVPNLTFVATSNAVIMAGATPIFCDVDSNSMCIDPLKVQDLIGNKTKAIIPVHLYGNAADMDIICRIAEDSGLVVIEDAAQGVGVFLNGRHVGTIGDCGILSYYGNKTITCGEGGVVLTNSDEISRDCYRLKNHGRDKRGIFKHEFIGFNFSFTEMQAAVGISQMGKLPEIIRKKKEIHDLYVSELSGVGDVSFQKFSDGVSPVHWFTSFFTDYKIELAKFLLDSNVQTREFFYPLNMQPCYSHFHRLDGFEVSKMLFDRGISLPSSYSLTQNQQDRVISVIKKFFSK